MDMDVVGNKERLLKGILDGETTTDIEPASREERLLKAILEKPAGGGEESLPTTEGVGGAYEIAGLTVEGLFSLLGEKDVSLQFGEDNTAKVIGWGVENSMSYITCIDGRGNYRKLSVWNFGDKVELTVVTDIEIGIPFVELSAASQLTLAAAVQTFIAAAVASPNNYVHTVTNSGIEEREQIGQLIEKYGCVRTRFENTYILLLQGSDQYDKIAIDVPINGLYLAPNTLFYGRVSLLCAETTTETTGVGAIL